MRRASNINDNWISNEFLIAFIGSREEKRLWLQPLGPLALLHQKNEAGGDAPLPLILR